MMMFVVTPMLVIETPMDMLRMMDGDEIGDDVVDDDDDDGAIMMTMLPLMILTTAVTTTLMITVTMIMSLKGTYWC